MNTTTNQLLLHSQQVVYEPSVWFNEWSCSLDATYRRLEGESVEEHEVCDNDTGATTSLLN